MNDDTAPFVDFDHVWLAYNEQLLAAQQFAVEDISLQVGRGEFIAIVGPSGCGKSTFMKLTTGLHMPSRGTIRIGGEAVTGPLKISGMAFQAPSLLPWRTTLANVLLPLEIVEPYRRQYRRRRAEFEAKARDLLQSVGLAGYEDKYPWQLSGGMQQRVSIARALGFEPRILMMDEPFGALDEITRDRLNEQLQQLWQREKRTVVFVTHSIAEAIRIGNRILLLSPHPGQVKAELNSVPASEMGTASQAELETRINDMLFAHH